MTLSYLAQKVGTTAQTIQRLETGNMTVSLDWLQRIAEVFGLPAAALLVTDATASVPILGDIDARGSIAPSLDPNLDKTLSIVVASPSPIAARVVGNLDAFEPQTVLVANKIDFDPELLLEQRRCLLGLSSGQMLLRMVTTSNTGLVAALDAKGQPEEISTAEIGWVAPLTMAIRYF